MRLTIEAKAFRQALRFAAEATDNASTRYALSQVLLSVDPTLVNCVKLIGTDGRRMHIGNISHIQIAESEDVLREVQVLIDKKSIDQLLKLSTKPSDWVIVDIVGDNGSEVAEGRYRGFIRNPGVTISARFGKSRELMTVKPSPLGGFPNWKSVIPSDGFLATATAEAGPVIEMVDEFDREFLFASMEFDSQGCIVEQVQKQIHCPFVGDKFDIRCNLRFIRDALKHASKKARVEINRFKASADIYRLAVGNDECVFMGMAK